MGEAVRSAGFTDVVVKRFKKPLNCTGSDPKLREIGSYTYASLAEGLEGEGATAASRTPIPNPQPPSPTPQTPSPHAYCAQPANDDMPAYLLI